MNSHFKFRRATHDRDGNYLRDKFGKLSYDQQAIYDIHGCVVHLLDSKKGMSFEELLEEVRKDTTNFSYGQFDYNNKREGVHLPSPADFALSLVRLLETGFVEIVVD